MLSYYQEQKRVGYKISVRIILCLFVIHKDTFTLIIFFLLSLLGNN